MKKVLAFILALVLALSLAACGDNNNKIVGKWVSKVYVKSTLDAVLDQVDLSTLSNILLASLASTDNNNNNIRNTYSNLTIDVVLEFDKNNGYKMSFQGVEELESTVKANVEKVAEDFYDTTNYFRSSSLYKNMDRYSAIQYCVKTVMDALDLRNRFSGTIDQEYDIDNDKIYFINGKTNKADYYLYNFDGDKLIISDIVGDGLTSIEIMKDFMCGEYTRVT